MSTSSNLGSAAIAPASRQPRAEAPRPQYLELKANVHRKLLNRLNLEALANAERPRAEAEIRALLFELISEESTPLSLTERESLIGDVINELFGLGPLEALLKDPEISDILVNNSTQVFIACSMSSASSPRVSPTTMRSGRIRRALISSCR